MFIRQAVTTEISSVKNILTGIPKTTIKKFSALVGHHIELIKILVHLMESVIQCVIALAEKVLENLFSILNASISLDADMPGVTNFESVKSVNSIIAF